MLIVKEGIKVRVFMVTTTTGPKPRWFKGTDRLEKNKKNALGMQIGQVTAVMGEMFLVNIDGKDHTVYTADIDLPGFIES